MKPMHLMSYVRGGWHAADTGLAEIRSAVTGEPIGRIGSDGIDFAATARFAREVGGPALRAMTFHDRARHLKLLAQAVMDRKEELYALSHHSGATRADGWIDIEGGAGTLFAYSSKGRRELPDARILLDGPPEMLSRGGSFVGQHVFTPLQGVALHINAFNFPVWGMLEKLAPTLLAGVPAIVKPASSTAYVTEACVRILLDTGMLPDGALQFVAGSTGDLIDHLGTQDIVSFTGSAATAATIRANPVFADKGVRFVAEQDSLNACMLGPDATPDSPEFALFVKEVVREMTAKAGQKCTAIRRSFVPEALIDDVQAAISARLDRVIVGDPSAEGTTMGALASERQLRDVRAAVADLAREARIVWGDPEATPAPGGAFMSPVLLRCDTPWDAATVHDREAFGPVATLMPYRDLAEGVALCNRGQGSLVMSLFTGDPAVAIAVVAGAAAWHGRVLIVDQACAGESTGHGSPLPALVHGGPGRAGGGEEMGGIRGVHHYMQRTALQGSPAMLAAIGGRWIAGAPVDDAPPHPFRLRFDEVEIGRTIVTAERRVTLEDIEHFARFTGDTFYAHMDEAAAARNPFFPGRVAHGYLILSFAAGLFVDPDEGPVLANTGLDTLRFLKPLSPGATMRVRLTAKSKTRRNDDYGEVRWDVLVTDGDGDAIATYELLTMVAG
ncbi:oxepin-CoA hydrolase/3-oxo-5,6-dehydrosuberyl-CoA semialdehyde dehydrogenase [Sphingomonas jejuensis]|uniref:Oxepin-CoA hydrolase/3-oxo-5,6-dehydrosuberyl-CoA semialdehyde dehydrogenase n=1 Tax=Sphingomonas jejuensis TaxID=904715 RepID=A0ABX0XMH9_9SPHN|nr:phenylacetic acid degradation bifunctional protein PaaZ [Sphingomonas jejuensis]NJC34440.1 oxepin-CoA hydrolase/3-oxo-5,6-dehydrosuberyl-CoA semialdehyde dehydrogenase [Sphingomonas jejuensis]